jgi:hypothetical protein
MPPRLEFPVRMGKRCSQAWALLLMACLSARAQGLPDRPIVLGDGHVTLGGDVAWSVAPEDTGFFNYTDYESSTLRLLHLALLATVKAGDHLELLTEIRSENGQRPEPYALYLRVRPWADRNLDVLVGRVPPTFGTFARRTYSADNPLIGYPLAYQYLTSLRADAVPASVNELLGMRARGWLSNYSIGNLAAAPGVPLVSAFRWDTGIEVHAGNDLLDGTVSATTGTLSNPQATDHDGGPQLAGRVALHPIAGLIIGASTAHGAFVNQHAVRAALPDGRGSDFTQTAWGADLEYSRDYYLVRFESVVSRWTLPIVQPSPTEVPLTAIGTSIEGRYKIRPGLYAAARVDHLGFSEVKGPTGPETWDAAVNRLEVGGGYSLRRNLLLKVEFQHNRRDGGRVPDLNLGALQILYWF